MSQHSHDLPEDGDEGEMDLGLDLRSQVFLMLRTQNISLLEIAAQVAGYSKDHSPLKPDEVRKALRSIWEVYSEFYSWVDPEESEEEDEEDSEE